MAITPKLCIELESDGSTVTARDETLEYSPSNTSGYGTPNNDRSSYAAVLRVYYKAYDVAQTLVSQQVDYDALYSNTYQSSFIFNYGSDGHYIYVFALIPTSITPEEGAIIYSTGASALQQYNASLQLTSVFDWTELENVSLYETITVPQLHTTKLRIKKGELARDYFNCASCTDCNCNDEFKLVLRIREGISTASEEFNVSTEEAQRMVERLTKMHKIK